MNYLIVEGKLRINHSYIPELTKNYPSNTILHITRKSDPLPKTIPITGKYIIICILSERRAEEIIQYVKSVEDLAHYIFVLERYDVEIIAIINAHFHPVKILINKASEEEINRYIKEAIPNLSKTATEMIMKRYARREAALVSFVNEIKYETTKLTITKVKELLQEHNKATFTDMYSMLTTGKGNKEKIAELLFRYRHSYKTLKSYIQKELEEEKKFFSDIYTGILARDNKRKYSIKRGKPIYRITKSLELSQILTIEKLYILEQQIESVVNIFDLYKLILEGRNKSNE